MLAEEDGIHHILSMFMDVNEVIPGPACLVPFCHASLSANGMQTDEVGRFFQIVRELHADYGPSVLGDVYSYLLQQDVQLPRDSLVLANLQLDVSRVQNILQLPLQAIADLALASRAQTGNQTGQAASSSRESIFLLF